MSPSNAKLADPTMSTGTCLRAPAERQSIDSSTAFIQPSLIRLLLKLIGPLLTSAVLVLCSSFDEVRAGNRQRIEPVYAGNIVAGVKITGGKMAQCRKTGRKVRQNFRKGAGNVVLGLCQHFSGS